MLEVPLLNTHLIHYKEARLIVAQKKKYFLFICKAEKLIINKTCLVSFVYWGKNQLYSNIEKCLEVKIKNDCYVKA